MYRCTPVIFDVSYSGLRHYKHQLRIVIISICGGYMTTSLNELEYITELKAMGHFSNLNMPSQCTSPHWRVYLYKNDTVWLPFSLSRNGQNTIFSLGLYCARTLFDLVRLHLSSILGSCKGRVGAEGAVWPVWRDWWCSRMKWPVKMQPLFGVTAETVKREHVRFLLWLPTLCSKAPLPQATEFSKTPDKSTPRGEKKE